MFKGSFKIQLVMSLFRCRKSRFFIRTYLFWIKNSSFEDKLYYIPMAEKIYFPEGTFSLFSGRNDGWRNDE